LILLSNNIFKRYQACVRTEDRPLSSYCDDEYFKQFICFLKCTCMFIMRGKLAAMRNCFFLQMMGAFWARKPSARESGDLVTGQRPCTVHRPMSLSSMAWKSISKATCMSFLNGLVTHILQFMTIGTNARHRLFQEAINVDVWLFPQSLPFCYVFFSFCGRKCKSKCVVC